MRTRFLKVFLRVTGSMALLAVFAVVMPYAWMNAVHQKLSLGELPAIPIVGYLARSTSAFYAMLGGLLWFVSFDLPHYRKLLNYLAAAIFFFGVTLWGVDVVEGMPGFWRNTEGPINMFLGTVIFYCNRSTSD